MLCTFSKQQYINKQYFASSYREKIKILQLDGFYFIVLVYIYKNLVFTVFLTLREVKIKSETCI